MQPNPTHSRRFNKKKLIHWLHLWPGLISAIILFFVCLTGTILVYSDEIIDLSAGQARYVDQVLPQKLPSEKLIENALQAVPGESMSTYMVTYRDPARSVRFNVFSRKGGLNMVYVDPYSGKVLKVDKTILFFFTVAHLHESFMMGRTGQWIVDIATIVFLLEIVTGIILWWPKSWNRKGRKAAVSVKWNSPWKRLSFDLHRVTGIFASGILLVIVCTGLIIAFNPLGNLLLSAFGGENTRSWQRSVSSDYDSRKTQVSLNQAIDKTFAANPDKKEIAIGLWQYQSSPFFTLWATNRTGLKSSESPEIVYVDKESGAVNSTVPPSILRGHAMENMVWMLHMGNWMGPIGKLLTFLGGLAGCLLTVTGVSIWWKKRPRKKRTLVTER